VVKNKWFMAKFRNKYRIESARLQGWNYGNPGAYFITICTHNRIHHFGECVDNRMKLSTIGLIVQGCWFEIPRLNIHVRLGEFIVMPNHIHGVLILEEMVDRPLDVETLHDVETLRDVKTLRDVETLRDVKTLQCNVSTTDDKSDFFSNISPKSGSVSRILGSFKSACSYHIHRTFPDVGFEWQERFHDHIIRNDKSFVEISNYIVNNPLTWKNDKFHADK
jgi:REP element-mobilizing transposase RayT